MTTLRATGLTVNAGRRRLLDDVQLTMESGAVVALVGENGAGKSTLLDCLAGLRRPTVGSVFLDDDAVHRLPVRLRAQRIASLGQQNAAAEDLAAGARIAMGLVARRGPQALVDERTLSAVEAVASELDVLDVLTRRLSTLSGGERRRVEVARALVDEAAEVILLDEPHAGVDVRQTGLVSAALRRRAARGTMVVVSVHDLGAALACADRVIGLKAGRVVVDAERDAALNPAHLRAIYGVDGEVVRTASGTRGVLLTVP